MYIKMRIVKRTNDFSSQAIIANDRSSKRLVYSALQFLDKYRVFHQLTGPALDDFDLGSSAICSRQKRAASRHEEEPANR